MAHFNTTRIRIDSQLIYTILLNAWFCYLQFSSESTVFDKEITFESSYYFCVWVFFATRFCCVTTSCDHIDWMRCRTTSYKNRKKTSNTTSSQTYRLGHDTKSNWWVDFILWQLIDWVECLQEIDEHNAERLCLADFSCGYLTVKITSIILCKIQFRKEFFCDYLQS